MHILFLSNVLILEMLEYKKGKERKNKIKTTDIFKLKKMQAIVSQKNTKYFA